VSIIDTTLCLRKKASPFLFLWICQISLSSDFANSWQKRNTGNLEQTRAVLYNAHHISFYMFALYLVKLLAWQRASAPRYCRCGTSGLAHPRDTLWPLNSPDLNPVEYEVRVIMQERVYHTPITPILDVADLKQRLIAAWSGLQQHVIDEAIDHWRGWLRACVKTDGHYFEHLLL